MISIEENLNTWILHFVQNVRQTLSLSLSLDKLYKLSAINLPIAGAQVSPGDSMPT